ncbi:MAG: TetR family transcriptional regulator [Nitrosomonas sp.]|nr:MAG: TetR family transcriptional regulator [Nitrosomonas sp.]
MTRSSDTKERLITGALELVSERSYANVGVQELCEYAGAKKGSFYYFFKSKQDLMLKALEHQAQAMNNMILMPAFSSKLAPLKRIEQMFNLTYQYQKSIKEKTGRVGGCFFGNLALELSTQDELIRHRLDIIFNRQLKLIKQCLEEAVTAGHLSEIDIQLTAEAILAYWEGTILFSKVRNEPEMLKSLAKGVRELVIKKPK